MPKLNKNKICFWQRVCPGSYRLGDIFIEQIWHSEGVCVGNYMWHVIVDGKTVVTWAYLKDAKKAAHEIDAKINKVGLEG